MDLVLVRYGEIGLKSPGVRRYLESVLISNIEKKLNRHAISFSQVTRERGRIFIQGPDSLKAAQVVAKVFGVVSVSPAWTLSPNLQAIIAASGQYIVPLLQPGQTFAVRARRTKTQPFTSPEVAREVGAAIIRASKAINHLVSVNLDNPDLEVFIEVRQKQAFLFTEVLAGPGGLPYGSQGTVVGLHSGGIDSPVAQWLMMKRGCRVISIYFDTTSPKNKMLRERAITTARRLAEWIPESDPELIIVPYREILKTLMKTPSQKITCLLCKRMMYRIATKVAASEDAIALVTGETLGQVASQTLTNLAILDRATNLPVFRPLIGKDKTETMEIARKIGTYEDSAIDVGDCFAVPQRPAIAARLTDIEKAEKSINYNQLVEQGLNGIERITLANR